MTALLQSWCLSCAYSVMECGSLWVATCPDKLWPAIRSTPPCFQHDSLCQGWRACLCS